MDYGFNVPNRGALANPADLATLARRGEELGFAHLAVPDHIVVPRAIDSRYPYSRGGEWPGAAGDCLEQLSLLAWLAGVTRRARLMTSVMVVPHRPVLLAAKALTTIDVLSGGRLTVACGAGWLREEFEALGAPPFAERGRVTDETLQAFRELWTRETPRFDGAHVHVGDIHFAPKPVQRPHPPLWVGGESAAALRRVVRHGDGWYPIGRNPRHPLDTRERYAAAVARLRRFAEESGRDPDGITLAYWVQWYGGTRRVALEGGERMLFTGSAQEIAADIRAFRELGVRHLLLNFLRRSLDETLAAMQQFSEELLPEV